ncbi:MAG: DUF1993 family protein [Candidatus Margulisiibacteriota bacterium]
MSFSVYEISVPAFLRGLDALSGLLDKVKIHAEAKKIDPTVLLQTRLIPDQFPLAKQIQIATDTAKLFVPRLTGVQAPAFQDTETTLDEFQARIQTTVDFLKTLKPEQFDGWETKTVSFPWKPGQYIDAPDYVLQYALPNFYFHVTTAYSILRASGVEIGKSDYLRVNWKAAS